MIDAMLYVDEVGQIDAATRSGLCVVGLVIAESSARYLMRRVRAKFGSRVPREFGAARTDKQIVHRILTLLAEVDCQITIWTTGVTALATFDYDRNRLYDALIAELIADVFREGVAEVVIHKRYRRIDLERRLTATALNRVRQTGGSLKVAQVHQQDTIGVAGLELADAVAWAFWQERRRAETAKNLFALVQRRVVSVRQYAGKKKR